MAADAAGVVLQSWNAALLEVLLPTQGENSAPVLLACDGEALHAASVRAGVLRDQAERVLVQAVTDVYGVSSTRGISGVTDRLPEWARLAKPRPVPPFLAVLALAVLAASRMDRDDGHVTQEYYGRLAGTLRIEPLDQWPAVAGFGDIAELFTSLADWMADDLQGRRGTLALPEEPHPRLVGLPISQMPLRGRDRHLLSAFFHRYRRALDAGFDPLRLLRGWGGSDRLTQPAQRAIWDDEIAVQVRTTLSAAFGSWDGSVVDDDGRRVVESRLRLGASLNRVTLNLSCPGLEHDTAAQGPDGTVRLSAHAELVVPDAWLTLASRGPVNLDLEDGSRLRALPGPTMVFEDDAEGLAHVPAARDQPVWLLTSDPELITAGWEPERVHGAALPAGWILVVDVDPSELPPALTIPAEELGPLGGDTALVGGLPLSDGAWLVGYPPDLFCGLAEGADVELDGTYVGEVGPGETLALSQHLEAAGSHVAWVGDAVRLDFEMASRGKREAVGSLRHYLSSPIGIGAGAAAIAPPGCPETPMCCGALMEGDAQPLLEEPVMVRRNTTFEVLYRDGSVKAVGPPVLSDWQRAIGIVEGGRWPIPNSDEVVFLCTLGQKREIVAVRGGPVEQTDSALTLADELADCPVVDRTPDGTGLRCWQELVGAAAEAFEDEV